MADFKQAIEWMNDGLKVYKDKGSILFYSTIKFPPEDVSIGDVVENSPSNGLYIFNKDDFNSLDWEIYKKEDDWSLLSEWKKYVNKPFEQSTRIAPIIKTLKEKILQDIENTERDFNREVYIKEGQIRDILNNRFGF